MKTVLTEEWIAEKEAKKKDKGGKGAVPANGRDPKSQVRAKGQMPRHRPGVMNKTEQEYTDVFLVPGKLAGTIINYWYEQATFKLADDCRYTPDFMILNADLSIHFAETKGGFIREDSTIKLKMAAQMFPFKFVLAQKRAKKNGGDWLIKEM